MNRKQTKIALAAVGLAGLSFLFYKLYVFLRKGPPKKYRSNCQNSDSLDSSAVREELSNRVLYDQLITDAQQHQILPRAPIRLDARLKDIRYKVILNVQKGEFYQGVVKLSFWWDGQTVLAAGQEFFPINFNGSSVKFVMVNRKILEEKEVRYEGHRILLPVGLLRNDFYNKIEIIFQNRYSFHDSGFATYFPTDEHGKYSLRQQVTFMKNGSLDIEKIMPCLNCLNQCIVSLQVIHPETFEAIGNGIKLMERGASIEEYPQYGFLFDIGCSSLNRSMKDKSMMTVGSGFGQNSSAITSRSHNHRKRANTHFYQQKLRSIHSLFLFCSQVVELKPQNRSTTLDDSLLIRYFCKPNKGLHLSAALDSLHAYIAELTRRISEHHQSDIRQLLTKLDIIIIDDKDVEGYFSPGVMVLDENSLMGMIDVRTYYLIARAMLGTVLIKTKEERFTTLSEILGLNKLVWERFGEFANFLYLQILDHHKLYKYIQDSIGVNENQGHFLQYFSKEIRFMVVGADLSKAISPELKTLMQQFNSTNVENFWNTFLTHYNFLSPFVSQKLVQIALKRGKKPKGNRQLIENLKHTLCKSKFVLQFYENQQIQSDLSKFLVEETPNLQHRLTQIRVKQKFKDYITEKYEKYLPIASNKSEAQTIYTQFKKYKEQRNFHHARVLQKQIQRVGWFGKGKFLQTERISLDCGINSWKLLSQINMFPLDEWCFRLIRGYSELEE